MYEHELILVCDPMGRAPLHSQELTSQCIFFCNEQAYNPWAPDSRSFLYVTSAGMFHTPLMGNKQCLGEDTWHNQGATFGTWSRQ